MADKTLGLTITLRLKATPLYMCSSSLLCLSTEISSVSSGCQQGGCLTCSDYNGCLSCKPRFFMHLERIGMKQIGVCMTSCPPGFYDIRSPERNTCTSKTMMHVRVRTQHINASNISSSVRYFHKAYFTSSISRPVALDKHTVRLVVHLWIMFLVTLN